MTDKNRLVVVTGCDSGIGKSLCRAYLDRGWAVVASYLQTPPFENRENYFPIQLDLRQEGSVACFAKAVKTKLAEGFELAALVQNAGTVMAAPVENMPMEVLREVFEVNFFGIYSLTQKLIPELIADKSVLMLLGSMAGRIGLPYFSPYVASKFALEGFAECLRRELKQFGVKTVIFEPGAIATPIWSRSWENVKKRLLPLVGERYRVSFESGAEGFVAGGNRGLPPDKAAERMVKIGDEKKPKARYIISGKIWMDRLELLIPSGLMDRLIAGMFGM